MFRFTIRDLLWLMVVAALAVGWLVDHQRQASRQTEIESLRALTNHLTVRLREEQPASNITITVNGKSVGIDEDCP
jgi:hypothetical protein